MVDLDIDGRLEIVLHGIIGQPGSYSTVLHTISGISSGLSHVGTFITNQDLYAPDFGDVNGDGYPDIIALARTASGPSAVYLSLGTGNLTQFGPSTLIPFPFSPTGNVGLSVADLNRDGNDDLILNRYEALPFNPTSPGPTYVSISRDPLGSGSWRTIAAPGMLWRGSSPIFAQDFNGDGLVDLAGLQSYHPYNIPNLSPLSRIGFALGDGSGGFLAPQVMDLPGNFTHLNFGIGNFDGDQDLDLFVIEYLTSAIGLCRNQSRYGQGCAGPGLPLPRIHSGLPAVGNAQFTLDLDRAPPFAPAVLGLSLAPASAPIPCGVLLDFTPPNLILPFGTLGVTATDPRGAASLPLPIPGDPALAGATLYAQWGVVDATAPFGVALTQGAKIILR